MSVCIYMCAYVCVSAYIHIHIYVYVYVYVCTYMYMYMCVHIYAHMFLCIYIYMCVSIYICIRCVGYRFKCRRTHTSSYMKTAPVFHRLQLLPQAHCDVLSSRPLQRQPLGPRRHAVEEVAGPRDDRDLAIPKDAPSDGRYARCGAHVQYEESLACVCRAASAGRWARWLSSAADSCLLKGELFRLPGRHSEYAQTLTKFISFDGYIRTTEPVLSTRGHAEEEVV